MANQKRLFIIGTKNFPRGSAGANYSQYLALALISTGWKVIILGWGQNNECDYRNGRYCFRGIEYYNKVKTHTPINKDKKDFFDTNVLRYNMNKDDYFIFYGSNYKLLKLYCKEFDLQHITVARVEEMQPYQFKFGKFNPHYMMYRKGVNFVYKKIKRTFPISTVIEKNDIDNGCRTLRLPIMADPYEYDYVVREKRPQKLKFIYPGAKITGYEDNIISLFAAFGQLGTDELEHIELHITGMTINGLKKKLNTQFSFVENIGKGLILHEWLPYKDLVSLYRDMDYLILVRNDNAITRANFPSKVPELMCFGVIPVCTKVGDYTESYLYDGTNSIIFDGNSPEACLRTIKRCIETTDADFTTMRNQARNTAVERFSYEIWKDKINDFILCI